MFTPTHLLPQFKSELRSTFESRRQSPEGHTTGETILKMIRAGAGEDFLRWDFEQGKFPILEDYTDLPPTGLPVQVAEVQAGGAMLLQSLVSDNRIAVPPDYPLLSYREPNFEMRPRAHSRRPKRAEIGAIPRPPKPLAPLINAMLLAGGKTMRSILREPRRKASAASRGKNLAANVRARIYWLKKRGCHVAVKGRAQLQA